MVQKYKVEYIPGGATQNALRVAQVIMCTFVKSMIATRRITNSMEQNLY
jgi:hypothetical protein